MDGAANIRVDRAEAVIYWAQSTLNIEQKIKNKNTNLTASQ